MKFLHVIASGQAWQSGMMQNSRNPKFCFIRKKYHQEHSVHSSVRVFICVRVTGKQCLIMRVKCCWGCSILTLRHLLKSCSFSKFIHDISIVQKFTENFFIIKDTHILSHSSVFWSSSWPVFSVVYLETSDWQWNLIVS